MLERTEREKIKLQSKVGSNFSAHRGNFQSWKIRQIIEGACVSYHKQHREGRKSVLLLFSQGKGWEQALKSSGGWLPLKHITGRSQHRSLCQKGVRQINEGPLPHRDQISGIK